MSFLIFAAAGFFGGMLGGMGMGGGTLLIPALTVLLGVEQHAAQAANLIAFLPMSAFSLAVHSGQGLLRPQGLWTVIVPAVLLSAAGGLLASLLPSDVLSRFFGAFLVVLAVKQCFALRASPISGR